MAGLKNQDQKGCTHWWLVRLDSILSLYVFWIFFFRFFFLPTQWASLLFYNSLSRELIVLSSLIALSSLTPF